MMNGGVSNITNIFSSDIDEIQYKRAQKVANDIIKSQSKIIKSIKRLPPGALVTENNYKDVKNQYHEFLKTNRNEFLQKVKVNSQISTESLHSQDTILNKEIPFA